MYEVQPTGAFHFTIVVTADPQGRGKAPGGQECPPFGTPIGELTGPGPNYQAVTYRFSEADGCPKETEADPGTWDLSESGGARTAHVCQPNPDGTTFCFDVRQTGGPGSLTPTTTQPTTTTSTPSEETGKLLCPEARALVEGFGPDRLQKAGINAVGETTMTMDGADLASQWKVAISSYNGDNPNDLAYVTNGTPVAGELGALGWLFTARGLPGTAGAFTTGSEAALRTQILSVSNTRAAEGQDPHLTPGDVLRLSLQLAHGNVNQAMLTAHNTLRSLARGSEGDITGVYGDQGFITDHLVSLRSGDNGGPWYHMFGTAYMEMTVKGDWGPWLATGVSLPPRPGWRRVGRAWR